MIRRRLNLDLLSFPSVLQPLLQGALLYDSSCSSEARVFYIDKDGGYYLKRAPKGTLIRETELTRYFHTLGLAAEVLDYQSLDDDWLLTRKLEGEDMTHATYLSNPTRLCDILSERLARLHALPCEACPSAHTALYLQTAEDNYRQGLFDPSFSDMTDLTPDRAWRYLADNRHRLESNTLLHGDYCLPNILLDQWRFSGFVDVGNGGIGDRHIDLFWGAWTLRFNLKTDALRQRFFDGYGRDRIDPERLRLIGCIETFG